MGLFLNLGKFKQTLYLFFSVVMSLSPYTTMLRTYKLLDKNHVDCKRICIDDRQAQVWAH